MLKLNKKKVLITGGLGFIGSNLAIRLLKMGARVTIIDSLIPEYGGNLFNVENIRDKLTINISDVRDPYSMSYLIKGHDYLFNLAGQTSHIDSMKEPFNDLEINSKAQLSILESCRKHNPEIKIIFASTRQIYGRPKYLPVNEKHPLEPVDINGINKLAGEHYHLLYNKVYNINTCVLRLTNTYGPRMRIKDIKQTFVGIWIRTLLEGKSFEVWGGEQLRDFTYVDDVVEALILCAMSEKANGKIYNLGGTDIISLKSLAELMQSEFNAKYIIKQFPESRKKIDIGSFYSDFSLINEELGWKPKININNGLKATIKFYKQNLTKYI